MKLVKVSTYSEPKPESFRTDDHFYWVRLGNGKRVKFGSRRDAKAFLCETSEFLQDQLVELNFLHADIFVEFKRSLFYFDGRSPESQNAMKALEKKAQTSLDSIDYTFKKIFQSDYLRSNEQPFKIIASGCAAVIDLSKILIKLRVKRKDFLDRKSLESIASRSQRVLISLVSWGDDRNFLYEPINGLTRYKVRVLGGIPEDGMYAYFRNKKRLSLVVEEPETNDDYDQNSIEELSKKIDALMDMIDQKSS